jgi:hypothetical protein
VKLRPLGWGVVAVATAIAMTFFIAYRALLYDIDPPERGVIAEGDLPIRIDYECAEKAIRSEFPDAHVMGASAGDLPEGVEETLIDYYHPNDETWAVFAFYDTPSGSHVSHFFLGHGPKLPQSAFPPALKAMRRAQDALKRDCNVDLSSIPLKAVGQRVDALD